MERVGLSGSRFQVASAQSPKAEQVGQAALDGLHRCPLGAVSRRAGLLHRLRRPEIRYGRQTRDADPAGRARRRFGACRWALHARRGQLVPDAGVEPQFGGPAGLSLLRRSGTARGDRSAPAARGDEALRLRLSRGRPQRQGRSAAGPAPDPDQYPAQRTRPRGLLRSRAGADLGRFLAGSAEERRQDQGAADRLRTRSR